MKKRNIFLYHLAGFILGSVGIIAYVFDRLASPASGAGLGGVIAMPVIAFVFVITFGIACAVSLAVWLLVAHLRRKR